MDSNLRKLFLDNLESDLVLAESGQYDRGFNDPGWQLAGSRWWQIERQMYFEGRMD